VATKSASVALKKEKEKERKAKIACQKMSVLSPFTKERESEKNQEELRK